MKSFKNKKMIAVVGSTITLIAASCIIYFLVNKNGTDADVIWKEEGFVQGNVTNQGLVTSNGNKTVIASTSGVYSIDKNHKKDDNIIDVRAFHVNATEKGLVYENNSDESFLYFTSYDGKTNKALIKEPISNVKVVNEEIYFTKNLSNTPKLYKVNLDGKNEEVVLDEGTYFYLIHNGKLYYSNYSDGNTLYKADLNGENAEKILDMEAWRLSIDNGYIYFENAPSHEGKLYRIPLEGGEPELIIDRLVNGYIVVDKHIYYSPPAHDENTGFFQYNMENKQSKKISPNVYYGFGKVGNSLFMNEFGFKPMVEFDLKTEEFLTNKGG